MVLGTIAGLSQLIALYSADVGLRAEAESTISKLTDLGVFSGIPERALKGPLLSMQDDGGPVVRFENAYLSIKLDRSTKKIISLYASYEKRGNDVTLSLEDLKSLAVKSYRAMGYDDEIEFVQAPASVGPYENFFVATHIVQGIPYDSLFHGVDFKFDGSVGRILSFGYSHLPKPPRSIAAARVSRDRAREIAAAEILAKFPQEMIEIFDPVEEIIQLSLTGLTIDHRTNEEIGAGFDKRGTVAYRLVVSELNDRGAQTGFWLAWSSRNDERLIGALRNEGGLAKSAKAPPSAFHPDAIYLNSRKVILTKCEPTESPKDLKGRDVLVRDGNRFARAKLLKDVLSMQRGDKTSTWRISYKKRNGLP